MRLMPFLRRSAPGGGPAGRPGGIGPARRSLGSLAGPAALVVLAAGLVGCARAVRRTLILYEGVTTVLGPNQVTTRFNRPFIEANRNRIVLETGFLVDVVSRMINPAAFDGDLHVAGRSSNIGLRLVAEIKNASGQKEAVSLLRAAEGTDRPVRVVGVWRYWPEHAIGLPHRQGEPAAPLTNANPDHVFELHPVIRVEGLDLSSSLVPVEGFRPGSPPATIASYREARVTIRVEGSRVFVESPAGLANDLHFWMELHDDARETPDGRFVTGRVRDREGALLVDSIRMVFVRGTPPDEIGRGLRPGTVRRVWGLPRISFEGLYRVIQDIGADTMPRTIPLPYELIILGFYDESQ